MIGDGNTDDKRTSYNSGIKTLCDAVVRLIKELFNKFWEVTG